MKKFATVLIAAVFMVADNLSLNAQKAGASERMKSKLTKMKGSPAKDRNSGSANQSGELTANIFVQSFSQSGKNFDDYGIARSNASKIMITKEDREIDAALIRLGYKKEYRNTSEVWNDAIDEMMKCSNACFTKEVSSGKIVIKEDCGYWEIKFPSEAEKNKFLKTAESMGYAYNSGWNAYIVPGTEEDYWIANYLFVDGNNITIQTGGE